MQSINNKEGKLFFINGPGGTGKTHLYKTILYGVKARNGLPLPTASSGIAALLLPRGRTAHSRFNIPREIFKDSLCGISKQDQLCKLIQLADVIIWDEAPMDHKHCFEAVHHTLQDLMDGQISRAKELPFGGKTVVMGGDFRQCLPVIKKATRSEVVNASICNSFLWMNCQILNLRKNMRLLSNQLTNTQKAKVEQFSKWILSIGDGTAPGVQCEEGEEGKWIEIPEDLLIPFGENAVSHLIDVIYPEFENQHDNHTYLSERSIVTPKNSFVTYINDLLLDRIPESEYIYLSYDSVERLAGKSNHQPLNYAEEYLNSLEFAGLPSHELRLKVGAPIMLMRNLKQNAGLCNGTRLIITRLATKVIEAVILTGSHVGNLVNIPRISLKPENVTLPFVLKRRQFPVRVCYAMTINKSQGQTLKKVGIYLPQPVFTHGQLYVALSRVQERSGLKIVIDNSNVPQSPGWNYTKNIVYKEIFHSMG
ncbi:hypothetical protein SLE2022_338290 [Rubroshorea leprosula]